MVDQVLDQSLDNLGHRFMASWQECFFQTIDDVEYSYGDLWHNATRLCQSWQDEGLVAGDIVAFKLPNSFALPVCYFACALGGFIACPIVLTLRPETIQGNLKALKPALFIEDVLEFNIESHTREFEPSSIDTEIPFLIMFSSGSTGANKAICHCLSSVLGSAASFAQLSGMSAATALYHVLPMTYMAGFLNSILAVFTAGGKIVEGPQFSMATVADFWRRPLATDANTLSVIPPLAAAICRLTRDPAKIDQVAKQFTQVQCTSQSIQDDLKQQFLEKFSLPLQDCYGMTELGGPLTFQSKDNALALNAFSEPLPELELELREDGALWIKSPFSMLGYLIDDELVDPFDADGFLDTGDIAALRTQMGTGKGEIEIEITGRVKDIIIRAGINTSPARIESIISTAPEVDEVSVVGLPHSFWGEEIVACIVTLKRIESTEGSILNFCRANLDSHEVPNRLIFLDELPRSFIGKVLKADLKSIILNEIILNE